MFDMQELVLKILSEVKLSSFKEACARLELDGDIQDLVIDYLDRRVRGN